MSEIIIPKPGTIYSENLAQGSDNNYYVKNNDVWVKVGGSNENINPLDPRSTFEIPAAKKGDKFYVVADGIIGTGENEIKLEKSDFLICINTTEGGIAADYDVLQSNITSEALDMAIKSTEFEAINVPVESDYLLIKDSNNDLKAIVSDELKLIDNIDKTNTVTLRISSRNDGKGGKYYTLILGDTELNNNIELIKLLSTLLIDSKILCVNDIEIKTTNGDNYNGINISQVIIRDNNSPNSKIRLYQEVDELFVDNGSVGELVPINVYSLNAHFNNIKAHRYEFSVNSIVEALYDDELIDIYLDGAENPTLKLYDLSEYDGKKIYITNNTLSTITLQKNDGGNIGTIASKKCYLFIKNNTLHQLIEIGTIPS